jgi:hypothetical protein
MNFVNKKNFAAVLVKGSGKFKQVMGLKVGAVYGNIEGAIVAVGGVFFDHLQHQRRLTRAPGAENAYTAQIPVNDIVEIALLTADGFNKPGLFRKKVFHG